MELIIMSQELEQNQTNHQSVLVSKIHPSKILPKRNHGQEISKSIEKVGILVPLIVRCLPDKSDEYELVDGHGRFEGLKPDQWVTVEIIKATDIETFRISNATFQRKDRSAYEMAVFYGKWLEAITGKEKIFEGAQGELARLAGCTDGLISQYLAVHNLFIKLESLAPDFNFSALKKLGLNPLYQLNRLFDSPKLLDKAKELEKNPRLNLKEVKLLVKEARKAQVDPNELSESQLDAMESLKLVDNPEEPAVLPTELGSEKQFSINHKLKEIVPKATQNLTNLNEILSELMPQIVSEVEKSALSNVLNAIAQVLMLFQKLQLIAGESSQQIVSAETSAASSESNGDET
jgi:hypothetical protein